MFPDLASLDSAYVLQAAPSKTKARIARYPVAASHSSEENAHVGHPSHPY
jgi:hypothetical protein